MIRLKSLLAEISLSTVKPYATQFVWRDKWSDGEFFDCTIDAEGHPIMLSMHHFHRSQLGDSGEWQFAYFVRSRDSEGWTTSAGLSSVAGAVNVLRLFKTMGEAVRDFAETHPNVDVIDVSGGDMNSNKEMQKSRIYAELLASNPDLNAFKLVHGATRLYLVRKNPDRAQPDASGIDTPGDPNM
jgi:hypothetical protein